MYVRDSIKAITSKLTDMASVTTVDVLKYEKSFYSYELILSVRMEVDSIFTPYLSLTDKEFVPAIATNTASLTTGNIAKEHNTPTLVLHIGTDYNTRLSTSSYPFSASAAALEQGLSALASQYVVPLDLRVEQNVKETDNGDLIYHTYITLGLADAEGTSLRNESVYMTANRQKIPLISDTDIPVVSMTTTNNGVPGHVSFEELPMAQTWTSLYRRHVVSVAYPIIHDVEEVQTLV